MAKHNKKRNTAFLFEVLLKEVAKTTISRDEDKKNKVSKVIKKYFKKDSELTKELELYQTLLETQELKVNVAERLLEEVKREHQKLDQKKIFNQQTKLINEIHNEVGSDVFSNFIKNYRPVATVYQIFNSKKMKAKDRVLVENTVVERLSSEKKEKKKDLVQPLDKLTFNTFADKFNKKYGKDLFKEQKQLLSTYVFGVADGGVSLKTFLNEEIGRLEEELKSSLEMEEINEDEVMLEKTEQVLEMLGGFKKKAITEEAIEKILKIQDLVREIKDNDN